MEIVFKSTNGYKTKSYVDLLKNQGFTINLKETKRDFDDDLLIEKIIYDYFIEINTIEEILKINEYLKHEIIFGKTDDRFFIEIYDEYREWNYERKNY